MAIPMTRLISRRDFTALAGGVLLSTKAAAQTETPLLTRPIPGSGERINSDNPANALPPMR